MQQLNTPDAGGLAAISEAEWRIAVPDACQQELRDAVMRRRAGSAVDAPPGRAAPGDDLVSQLPGCAALAERARAALRDGVGFVVLDRLPSGQYDVDENRYLCGLLSTLIGPVVAQKQSGVVLYDVRDTGRALGYGVRRSITNLEQQFHTDGGWLHRPPELIGLYCIRPAAEGGLSRCISISRLHNALLREAPELLARLYRPFFWDRQAEHSAEAGKVSAYPVFEQRDGRLLARLYTDYIDNGYRLAGATLDAAGRAALDLLADLADDPRTRVEFRLQAGQFQYVNNHRLAHSRTAFRDDGARSRHFVRVWNRFDEEPDPAALARVERDGARGERAA